MSGSRFRPWLVFGLIFIVGMISGAALTWGHRAEWMRPPGAKQMQHHWLQHLTESLNLTSDQQAKLQPILEKASEQIRAVHADEVGRVSTIFQTTDAQINSLLTADQQATFTKLKAERQRDFPHHPWHNGGPPPGPQPPHEGPGAPPPPPH